MWRWTHLTNTLKADGAIGGPVVMADAPPIGGREPRGLAIGQAIIGEMQPEGTQIHVVQKIPKAAALRQVQPPDKTTQRGGKLSAARGISCR